MRIRLVLPLALIPLMVACTATDFTGPEITIEHPSNQFIIAEVKADDYCAEKGRRAQHVQTQISQQSVLFFQSSISVFRCVVPGTAKTYSK